MLKNAKTEYFNEHEEISTYLALETFATKVGDRETAKLARDIRRDEERMAKFLDGQIKSLANAVALEEVPRSQRGGTTRRKAKANRVRTKKAAKPKRARAKRRKRQAPRAKGRKRGSAQLVGRVRLRSRLELDLPLGPRRALFDLEAALALGVELVAEEDRQVADPEPDQQRDQPAEGAVGLVVGAEVGDVEGEGGGGDDPDDDRDDAARRHPAEAAQLDVRRGVVEDADHEQEDRRHHRPLGDAPDRRPRCR